MSEKSKKQSRLSGAKKRVSAARKGAVTRALKLARREEVERQEYVPDETARSLDPTSKQPK